MKTVAVIGLGPAGLVAVKELKAKGFFVTAFDKQDAIGGVWSNPGKKHGIYEQLNLNTSRAFSEFSDFPWRSEDFPEYAQDAEGGAFASCKEFNAYLQAYAKHFELDGCFKLKTSIQRIERASNGSGYVLFTSASKTPQEFDALVVCSGRHMYANHILKAPLASFSGTVEHSEDFKSLSEYDGKRVLVIGSSVSGSDLSSKLASRGKYATVTNSVRTVPYHLDKFNPDGQVSDEFMFIRLICWIKKYMPEGMGFQGMKSNLLQNCPDQLDEDLLEGSSFSAPDPDVRKAGVGYTSGYVQQVREKRLSVKPDFQSVAGSTVKFVDGSSADFDVIICGTGYKGWDLSILPTDIQSKSGR